MAFDKVQAESRITELGLLVLPSLIVMTKWEDAGNYAKRVDDVNQCLFDVQRTLIQPKGKRFKRKKYYRLLFAEQVQTTEGITQYINRGLRGYKGLKVNCTDAEVYKQLYPSYLKNRFTLPR